MNQPFSSELDCTIIEETFKGKLKQASKGQLRVLCLFQSEWALTQAPFYDAFEVQCHLTGTIHDIDIYRSPLKVLEIPIYDLALATESNCLFCKPLNIRNAVNFQYPSFYRYSKRQQQNLNNLAFQNVAIKCSLNKLTNIKCAPIL